MNSGARLGLAVTAAYVLGRFHKMKWALALAAFATRGRLPTSPAGLLQQGAKVLASSPELTKLTDDIRGRLLDAGKAAAVAAVSSKINSLSDELSERSEAMRAAGTGGNGGARAGGEEDAGGDRHRDEDKRARAEDRRPKRHPDEGEAGRVPTPRRPPSRRESDRTRATRQSRSREDSAAHGHPSRHSSDGDGARSSAGAGQRQDGERSRPRSPASRTGGDSE